MYFFGEISMEVEIRDIKYNTRKNGRSTYSEEEGEKKATEGNNSIITAE